jgi:hypothetical protein
VTAEPGSSSVSDLLDDALSSLDALTTYLEATSSAADIDVAALENEVAYLTTVVSQAQVSADLERRERAVAIQEAVQAALNEQAGGATPSPSPTASPAGTAQSEAGSRGDPTSALSLAGALIGLVSALAGTATAWYTWRQAKG